MLLPSAEVLVVAETEATDAVEDDFVLFSLLILPDDGFSSVSFVVLSFGMTGVVDVDESREDDVVEEGEEERGDEVPALEVITAVDDPFFEATNLPSLSTVSTLALPGDIAEAEEDRLLFRKASISAPIGFVSPKSISGMRSALRSSISLCSCADPAREILAPDW